MLNIPLPMKKALVAAVLAFVGAISEGYLGFAEAGLKFLGLM